MDDFKPGDVLAHPKYGRGIVLDAGSGWAEFADLPYAAPLSEVADARRLVVIDPEDREQVERLVKCTYAETELRDDWKNMQAALREFADPKPPKPDEPTGLGAVVEDFYGHRYVRTGWPEAPWCNVSEEQSCTWAHVAAVRVLSEGVQP